MSGDILDNDKAIKQAVARYFQSQLQAEGQVDYIILDVIPSIVTNEWNDSLIETPSMAEIKSTVLSLSGDSAAGPDGFTGNFF